MPDLLAKQIGLKQRFDLHGGGRESKRALSVYASVIWPSDVAATPPPCPPSATHQEGNVSLVRADVCLLVTTRRPVSSFKACCDGGSLGLPCDAPASIEERAEG